MNHGWTGKDPALDVTLLSLHPKVMRFRGMLTAKECALLRFLMLEALIYLDDLGTPLVSSRPGTIRNASASAFGELGSRPWLRSQNTGHISFYFKEPPEFMNQLIERVGKIAGVHPNNVEPIYHLYVPATLPSNLHLDNFNKYLFPHRHLSVSLFLDDHEDGGTVFPLMLDSFGDTGGSTTLALDHNEVQKWQRVLNEERLQQVRNDSEAYDTWMHSDLAHRRVDLDEPHGFRHRLLEAAQLMCRSGRIAQMPVLPEKGTMYLWFNYLPNGEDDVRSIHAGCSSSASYKMLGAFFLRDAAGPFPEHDSFWHPSKVRQQANDELQRQVEMMAVNAFRFDHIAALFNMERHAVFELHGAAEAVRLATFHHEYAQHLVQREVGSSWRSDLDDIIDEHGLHAEVPWYRQSMDGLF